MSEMSTVISPFTGEGLPRFLVATGVAVTASAARRMATEYDVTVVVAWSGEGVNATRVTAVAPLTVTLTAADDVEAPASSRATAVRE